RQPGGVYDITLSNQSAQTIGGVTYHSADLQIGIDPIVGKEQRVSFLVNQLGATPARAYTFSSEFRPADTHTITIRAIDVIPGTYLVRVQVDGVESRLEAPAGTYAAPTVTLLVRGSRRTRARSRPSSAASPRTSRGSGLRKARTLPRSRASLPP